MKASIRLAVALAAAFTAAAAQADLTIGVSISLTGPTSALGISFTMPSSMPSPARRIGTISGFGSAIASPSISATSVWMVTVRTRTARVAS